MWQLNPGLGDQSPVRDVAANRGTLVSRVIPSAEQEMMVWAELPVRNFAEKMFCVCPLGMLCTSGCASKGLYTFSLRSSVSEQGGERVSSELTTKKVSVNLVIYPEGRRVPEPETRNSPVSSQAMVLTHPRCPLSDGCSSSLLTKDSDAKRWFLMDACRDAGTVWRLDRSLRML